MSNIFRFRYVPRIIIASDMQPTPEQTRLLRQHGFDFDRRNLVWYYEPKADVTPVPEEQLAATLARLTKATKVAA